MWPVLATILVGGAVIGGCFAGIFSEYKAEKGFQNVSCSGSYRLTMLFTEQEVLAQAISSRELKLLVLSCKPSVEK